MTPVLDEYARDWRAHVVAHMAYEIDNAIMWGTIEWRRARYYARRRYVRRLLSLWRLERDLKG